MKVDVKMTGVEIDYETADNVTRAVLMDTWDSLSLEIACLEAMDAPLEPYKQEDLDYNKVVLSATGELIKYFTAPNEWPEELKEE